jgi:hypothetical protein
LNFCKRCGANLAAPTDPSGEPESTKKPLRVAGIFWAVAVFGMVSIFSLMGAIIALAALRADGEAIAATAIFGSAGIFGIVSILLRYGSKLMQSAVEPERPKAIDASPPLQITPPPRAVSSVTEHTTRNFDPIASEWEAQDRQ